MKHPTADMQGESRTRDQARAANEKGNSHRKLIGGLDHKNENDDVKMDWSGTSPLRKRSGPRNFSFAKAIWPAWSVSLDFCSVSLSSLTTFPCEFPFKTENPPCPQLCYVLFAA